MEKIFEIASKISTPLGIAGVFAAALFLICRQIIKKDIFPTLTKNLSADIIRLIIKRLSMLTLVSLLLGFAGFALVIYKQISVPNAPATQPQQAISFSGRVIDSKTAKTIQGAKIIVTAKEKQLTDESDSKGIFVVTIQPPVESVDLRVMADNYGSFFEHSVTTVGFKEVSLSRVEPDKTDSASRKTSQESPATNQEFNNVNPDRFLSGVEVSYQPSSQHWAKIIEAYQKLTSPIPSVPYSSASLTAEGVRGYWIINFAPLQRREGVVQFAQVSTEQANTKAFEDVIRAATLGLWIKWGDGGETELEPLRDHYPRTPSTITVSQDKIAFTFRPPDIILNFIRLKANPTITFRGRDYLIAPPNDITIRSLDPEVVFDQTIHLNWKKEEEGGDSTHIARMMPYISGPHLLNITLATTPAAVASDVRSPAKTDGCGCSLCAGILYCPNPGYCLGSPCGQVCCNNRSN